MAEWTGNYLMKARRGKSRAHYWTGTDTVCRMWSTGGMGRRKGYAVHPNPEGKEICTLCEHVWLGARLPDPPIYRSVEPLYGGDRPPWEE